LKGLRWGFVQRSGSIIFVNSFYCGAAVDFAIFAGGRSKGQAFI
jgi:hypothetical protein